MATWRDIFVENIRDMPKTDFYLKSLLYLTRSTQSDTVARKGRKIVTVYEFAVEGIFSVSGIGGCAFRTRRKDHGSTNTSSDLPWSPFYVTPTTQWVIIAKKRSRDMYLCQVRINIRDEEGNTLASIEAVATLESSLCIIAGSLFETGNYDDDDEDGYIADFVNSAIDNIDASLKHPLHSWNANIVLIVFDAKRKKGRSSEFGFAWLDIFDV